METKTSRVLLLVDDIEANRVILKSILAPDYTMLEATGGWQALQLMREHPELDLVLLDLMLSDMDGFEVLHRMQCEAALAALPVVATTMYDEDENEIRALRLGAVDFICKPYHPEAVRQRIHNIVAKRAYDKMLLRAERDMLTGIYHEEIFYRHTAQMIAEHPEQRYQMVCWEIERFKDFNRLFGTWQADEALRCVANWLRDALHNYGTYARLGADGFAACLPMKLYTPQQMMEHMEKRLQTLGLYYCPVLRAGVYRITPNEIDPIAMCACAKYALACMKHDSAHIALYDAEMHRERQQKQQLLYEFPEALAGGDFSFGLQPIFDIRNGQLRGAEALARWNHPQYGSLLPEQFLPLLEENGLTHWLDMALWEQMCRKQSESLAAGVPIVPISVNMARTDFFYLDVEACWRSLLQKYRLDAKWVCIEVSELSCRREEPQLPRAMQALHQMGICMALHDYGNGEITLPMLAALPLDSLKLDAALWATEQTDRRIPLPLSAVAELARGLGLCLTAKGVETQAQYDALCSAGCIYLQGRLLAPPMEWEQLGKMLAERRKSV